MTPRERVQTALDHREPDRVPIDLGATVVSSIAIPAYAELRQALGLPRGEITVLETVQQIARVDDDVLDLLGVDAIPVLPHAPAIYQPEFRTDANGTISFQDEFGATLYRPPGSHYYDWRSFPLGRPSCDDLAGMRWPDPTDPGRYAGLRAEVSALRQSSPRALVGMAPCGHDLFNQLLRVRGMEEGLMDLVAEPEFAEAFLDRLTDTICTAQSLYLDQVGDLIDVHFTADDLAGQASPLISPKVYRRLIKPRQARIMQTIRSRTKAKILYHSCGALGDFLDDLVEIGVEALNPVQVSAVGMDTSRLKQRYGQRLSFWGGGCDTQRVLNQGSPAEVRAEVRRRVADLAPGGGFVFNPVHNVQSGVPAANIVAMFDQARVSGVYPSTRSNAVGAQT